MIQYFGNWPDDKKSSPLPPDPDFVPLTTEVSEFEKFCNARLKTPKGEHRDARTHTVKIK